MLFFVNSKYIIGTIAFSMAITACVWDNPEMQDLAKTNYLPLDDSEFPYAGLPRFVIETDQHAQIRNTSTEIPAKLQIYGQNSPINEIREATIRGRGNSSFKGMPKYSIKLELENKASLCGMPQNRDWALIANSADKTLLKNFITYKLAGWLGDEYTPKAEFIELYLNREYLGVYMLTETVKIGKNRVDIPEDGSAFLMERGPTERGTENFVVTDYGTTFSVKKPKIVSYTDIQKIKKGLSTFESFLRNANTSAPPIDDYIDMTDYLRYYWIQELSKNLDGAFRRSIYFTWQENDIIKMGPVWDFDVAYGNWTIDSLRTPSNWYIRPSGWNGLIFKNKDNWKRASDYWRTHRDFIESIPDSVNKYAQILYPATKNEFKRWPVLENTENWTYKEPYNSYSEAVDSLNSWIKQRIKWIDKNL